LQQLKEKKEEKKDSGPAIVISDVNKYWEGYFFLCSCLQNSVSVNVAGTGA